MPDDRPLPAWLTPRQYVVLSRVVTTLESLGIPYAATGGLAGNLHGSTWPLHDIDLDVPRAALHRVAEQFPLAVRFGPAPFRDSEFELDLLTLAIDGVDVDLSAAESVALRRPDGQRLPHPVDLARTERRDVGGLTVHVMPLADLVEYKRLIGREADVRELEALRREE